MQYIHFRSFPVLLSLLMLGTTCGYARQSEEQRPLKLASASTHTDSLPTSVNHELLIGSGDLLEVSVYGAPDFDKREVRVDSSGAISLPLIGTVTIAGLPVRAAEELLAKRLSDGGYFSEPRVSVFEKEYATQGISVLGEVQKPGVYPLLGQRTLFDAISLAGGTTPKAGNMVTITHRAQPQQSLEVPLSYSAGDSSHTNLEVYPGDTIVVSKAGLVYVVGDVRQPSGFLIDKSELTVLQAIALAQGTNPTAALQDLKLVRTTSAGRQETAINLKRILEAKDPDVKLQTDDIIFVPTSAAKSVTRRSLEAIIQTATGVAIYRR
jgi:polysaccharide biosynthesis/export protein